MTFVCLFFFDLFGETFHPNSGLIEFGFFYCFSGDFYTHKYRHGLSDFETKKILHTDMSTHCKRKVYYFILEKQGALKNKQLRFESVMHVQFVNLTVCYVLLTDNLILLRIYI